MIERFYKPKTIQEALSLKKKLKDDAIFLAGGTLVNSKDFPQRFTSLISLEGLKENDVKTSKKGEVRIGALCTLEQLIENNSIPEVLRKALSQVVSRNIRNMATLGGHIAGARACSDLIPALIALEAEIEIYKPSAKYLSLEEYLKEKPDGLITEISLPRAHTSRSQAFANFRLSSNSTSLLIAVASVQMKANRIIEPIIVLAGAGRRLARLTFLENKLHGEVLPPADEVAALVKDHLKRHSCRSACITPCMASCIEYDAGYVQYQSAELVARTVKEACREKEGRNDH